MTYRKTLATAALLALASIASVPAHAQTAASQPWMGGRMDTNLYLGAGVGQSRFKSTCDDVPVSCDNKDTAWKVFAGWQFHRNFAVEGGYFNLGKASASGDIDGVGVSADAKVRGWEILGVGILPVTNEISLFAKAGVARSRVRVNASGTGSGFTARESRSDDSSDFTYGVGAQYAFTRNVAVRAEWQRYDSVGGDNSSKDNIDVFSAGLMYRF